MAPTEYRVIAKRATLHAAAVTQGPRRRRRGAQPRGPARLARGDRAVDPRRLRPDRDRPAHRRAARRDAAPRLDGQAAAGRRPRRRRRRARAPDPTTDPTFFLRYLGDAPHAGAVAHRRPRHPRRGRLPVLRGPHRRRDHLRRLPDRAVRGRVGARRAPRGGRGGGGRRARTTSAARSSAPSSCCATATRRQTRWSRSCRTTSRARPRPTSTRASWTSRRTCPRPARARSAAQLLRAVVVDRVNVSVLLYVPVRSASFGVDLLR